MDNCKSGSVNRFALIFAAYPGSRVPRIGAFAGCAVSIRSSATLVRIVAASAVIAEHARRFGRDVLVCQCPFENKISMFKHLLSSRAFSKLPLPLLSVGHSA